MGCGKTVGKAFAGDFSDELLQGQLSSLQWDENTQSLLLQSGETDGSYLSPVFAAGTAADWQVQLESAVVKSTFGSYSSLPLPPSSSILFRQSFEKSPCSFSMGEVSSLNAFFYSGCKLKAVPGRKGKALEFIKEAVFVPQFEVLPQGSIEFWIKGKQPALRERILGLSDSFEIRFEPKSTSTAILAYDLCVSGTNTLVVSKKERWYDPSLSEQAWFHVVVTWNSVTRQWASYINGQLDASGSGIGSCAGLRGDLSIGTSTWKMTDFFQGVLDELVLYNRELSTQEVLSRYGEGSAQLHLSV